MGDKKCPENTIRLDIKVYYGDVEIEAVHHFDSQYTFGNSLSVGTYLGNLISKNIIGLKELE